VGDELGPGDTFAGFRIEAMSGRGGMSVVYRARDVALDRTVALKVMATRLSHDPGFRARFAAEARTASQIDHPNVVPVYGAGEIDGRLFLAMRYVAGDDLADLLAARDRLAPGDALDLVGQAARALDAVHRAGHAHGDVKPANLLLSPTASGRVHVYLTDFGLAGDDPDRTRPGSLQGTVAYAAPEVIRGGEPTPAADQYALAALLVHVLTGRPPFDRDDEAATLYAHLHDAPPSLLDREPRLPAAIDAVIARGLAKDPSARFASCGQLADAARTALGDVRPAGLGPLLLPVVDEAATTATTTAAAALAMPDADEATRIRDRLDDIGGLPPPSGVDHADPRSRRRRVVAIAGAAVLVLVLVLVATVVVAMRGGSTEPPPPPPPPPIGGSATVAVAGTPASWNPTDDLWDADTVRVATAVYDPLVVIGDGTVQPWLAESVTDEDDGSTWVIRLRDGINFHDGTPLDAEAVRANLAESIADPEVSQWLAPVERADVVDARTVRVTMRQSWVAFDWALTTQVGLMASPGLVQGEISADIPVGTGPFRWSERTDAERVRLDRNPAYWRPGLPALDRLELVTVVAAADRREALTAGTADAAALPRSATGDLQGFGSSTIGRSVVALAANVGRSPTASADVRTAIGAATDDASLARRRGTVDVASPYPDPPWTIPGSEIPFDPEAADQLVDAYRAANGLGQLTLTASGTDGELAREVVEQWRRAGITSELDIVDGSAAPRLTTGDFEVAVTRLPVGDPDLITPMLHSVPPTVAEGTNVGTLDITRFTASTADDALDAARRGGSTTDRTTQYTEAVQRLNERPMLGYRWLFADDELLVSFRADLALESGEVAGSPFARLARTG
jgi:ABC-type transport system substrate-binding protein